jgi:phosphatidyl-myo-inositol dimannoside synthase
MRAERTLLTIGHSYVVAHNRRLAHEMAVQGRGRWRVTAIAPSTFRGDLRQIPIENIEGEVSALRHVSVRLDRSPHLMWYAGLRAAMEGQWDVIHCWEEPYVLAAAQIAACASKSSTFVPATFQNIAKIYPWPLSAFEGRVMRRMDGWIAFGETIRETLHDRAPYRAKSSHVIAPGVDLDVFAPNADVGRAVRQRCGWAASALVVGFVGRFVPEKGVHVLCDALRALKADWKALFVGGGPLEPDLRRFEREHRGRVQVVTGVAHADVPQWMNAMTVLCAPSLTTPTWREQFGRMLIEAMGCGVPLVASNSGEIPHVLTDAGILVPESDAGDLAEAIGRMLENPALRRTLASRGRERAHAHFSWPVIARRHLGFFEALMEQRAAA